MRVRAFYLDIAQWAVEEPGPLGAVGGALPDQRRRGRPGQGTQAPQGPDGPAHPRAAARPARARAHRQRAATRDRPPPRPPPAHRPARSSTAPAGRCAGPSRPRPTGGSVWAEDTVTGKRRNLSYEEEEAFWAFATIEVLRLTGIRCEELLELTHHSITEYRLPSTGELVPLLQIAPSKTDTERLLLVSPELADVLARSSAGSAAPTARSRWWSPTTSGNGSGTRPCRCCSSGASAARHRAFTPTAIRKLLINALAATGLTDAAGDPLMFSPHDFRRIFVTDAIMSGLPPHIAQVICGHKNIGTTIGLQGRLPRRGDRSPPGVHRPPPRHPAQRGIPYSHRRGMGRLPRPLREAESLGRHLRPRIRITLRP